MDITRLTLDVPLGLKEPQEQKDAGLSAASRQSPPTPLTGEDRVELIRAQNLASPLSQTVDLEEALRLLAQVTRQVEAQDREDLRRLYHEEPLRELCCRLTESAGT